MDTIFELGLEWILALQQWHGPVTDSFFRGITFMGEEMFFLLFIPFLVWSVDEKAGTRIGIAYLLTAYLNPVLKDIFQEPRPFHINPTVQLSAATETGMPSGHAQSSVVFWGTLAWQVGKKWFWGIAVVLMLLIGFSRIFLGVHFPHQVFAGWVVGIGLLTAYVLLEPRTEQWLAGLHLREQLFGAFFIPILLALAFLSDSTVAAMAVIAGFGCGFAITRKHVPFSAAGQGWPRLLRYVIGAVVMLVIYLGLSAIFSQIDGWLYYLLRFIRYGTVGLWIGLGAPWLFVKLHLVETAVAQPQLQH